MDTIDIVDVWTRASEPLPKPTLAYIISPLPQGGSNPACWRMDRGVIEGGACFVMEDDSIRLEVYFAHGLTGEQRARAIEGFGNQMDKDKE